jgi:hypothetical protein
VRHVRFGGMTALLLAPTIVIVSSTLVAAQQKRASLPKVDCNATVEQHKANCLNKRNTLKDTQLTQCEAACNGPN